MDIREYLTRIRTDADAALALMNASGPVIVKAGDNLQAALDRGGTIQLEAGATFAGNFVFSKPGTRVLGPSTNIAGSAGGPAVYVPPGAKDVQIILASATTAWDQRVVMVGDNDPAHQAKIEDVPQAIRLSIFVPQHRGKTAFWINGRDVTLIDCGCLDVYDPAGRDSQGINILNTPGPVIVRGGTFEAASENILVGGDVTGIADVVPSNLLFENIFLPKRDAWRLAGKPAVKNNFELKAGINVLVRNMRIDGNWVSGQAGSAIVITPRNGKTIGNVTFEDVQLAHVTHAINMIAQDDKAYSPKTVGVTFRRVSADTTHRFLQMGGEFTNVLVEDSEYVGADNTIYSYGSAVWDTPTASVRNGFVSRGVEILRNRLACNKYGLMLTTPTGGQAYGANWAQAWPDGVISGNTFTGATALMMKKNLPTDNVFLAS